MSPPQRYQRRSYQSLMTRPGLVSFQVRVKETDLYVQAERDLTGDAYQSVLDCRHQIESYISSHPDFLASLVPVIDDPWAPGIVQEMIAAGSSAGVGPMASVAGAIAERVGRELLSGGKTAEVVVENGGDVYIFVNSRAEVGIFAGRSPLSHKIGIAIPQGAMPLGVCTSSGTVGHSLSFGRADAVTVLAKSTALADAAATAVGNAVKSKKDIDRGLDLAGQIEGLRGAVIIVKDKIGAWGEIELITL
ncbi:MAG: UPF0280 family protein [Pseudomonadota bacterium]